MLDAKRFLIALKNMGIDEYVFAEKEGPTLSGLKKAVMNCERCGLAKTRKNVVFGEGSPKAAIVFVGEAPGEEEDNQGRPFVGRAGKLLDQLIERIGLTRNDIFICNVLKCRPPGNRDPEPDEAAACKEYLLAQLDIIRPRIICTLGRHAYNTLLETDAPITRIRGKLTTFRGIPLLPTYHPSYLLRSQGRIKEAWEDMDKLKTML
ncbi:MAG: Uracil DNA glycosylase superfamily protein [Syntrophorhabdus sp. PtaB.Bin184]|jgi:uracil-DNA glycosylase family 4|nr:MAG: Uracil DNA glycosylase superfamily protein [Syntrophorhabdus sp. PtaB.Bin184]